MTGAANPVPPHRPARLASWLRRPGEDVPVANARALARRAQFEQIGEFLAHHELEISDANFAVVRAHLAGDPRVGAAMLALLRDHARLTDAMLAPLAPCVERGGLRPEAMGEMAEKLAREAAECLRIITASRSSGVEYRAALDAEVTGFSADPLGAFDRLIRLTSGVIEATRAMEEQLEVARGETERLRSNLRRAQREADRDHLTGLPNRRHFEARLGALERGAAATVALCDIDDFKLVNDRHGHNTGDRVLKYVARLLRNQLGERALVARYGGEEFVCLFEGVDAAEARDAMETAREQLCARSLTNQDNGQSIGRMTFSTGVATIAGHDPREALRRADIALYEAKRAGKNRVVIAAPAAPA